MNTFNLQTVPTVFLFLHITSEMVGSVALYSKYHERHNKASKLECEKSDNAACSCVLNKVRSYFTHIIQSVFTVDSDNFPTGRKGDMVAAAAITSRFVHSYIVHQFTKKKNN